MKPNILESQSAFKILIDSLVKTKAAFMNELQKLDLMSEALRENLTVEQSAKFLIQTEKMKLRSQVSLFKLWDIKKIDKERKLPPRLETLMLLEEKQNQKMY